jgi:hypothetical protein
MFSYHKSKNVIDKNGYIEITQDGIGRINFKKTPVNIYGLYTTGLVSCAGLILFGTDGITLIHDTEIVSWVTILREKMLVGKLVSWSIVMNRNADEKYKESTPDIYKKKYPNGIFNCYKKNYLNIGLDEKLYKSPGNDQCYLSDDGSVSVSKAGEIFLQKLDPVQIIPAPNKNKRHSINILNNYYADENFDLGVTGDLQFDSCVQSECSFLFRGYDEMKKISVKKNDERGFGLLLTHKESYGLGTLELLAEEKETKIMSDTNYRRSLSQICRAFGLNEKEFKIILESNNASNISPNFFTSSNNPDCSKWSDEVIKKTILPSTLTDHLVTIDEDYATAVFYYNQVDIQDNKKIAVTYFRLAAEEDHVLAQYNLGICLVLFFKTVRIRDKIVLGDF